MSRSTMRKPYPQGPTARSPRSAPHPSWAPGMVALSGLIIGILSWQTPLEEKFGLGTLYALRGTVSPPEQVVILGIDHDSATHLGAPDDPRDWPRELHAKILRRAQQEGAALVAFDIFFSGPGADPAADRAMAEALQAMGGAILTNYVRPRQLPSGVYIEAMVEPTAELAHAALATAPFLLPKDSSGSEFLTFFGQEEERATLPTQALLAYTLRTRFSTLAGLFSDIDPGLAAFMKTSAPRADTGLDLERVGWALTQQLRAHPELHSTLDCILDSRPLPAAERRMLRSLFRVLSNSEIRYFNHYGPARSFPTIPYHRLIAPAPTDPVDSLKGKIVLVGYLEDFQPESTEGLFYTPYSPVSSVELAATALANLLEDKVLQPVFSPLGELLWFAIWGCLIGLCAQAASFKRGLLGMMSLSLAYLGGAWALFANLGLWLPLWVPLVAQVVLGLIAMLGLGYLRRARHERTIQSVIHRFIPVEMLGHLAHHQDSGTLAAYGRVVPGVCLAADAGCYTALAETMDLTTLTRLMNAYYEVIFATVQRHGGWISDVIGDGVFAVWIADQVDDRPIRRAALAAARDIRLAIRRFEQEHQVFFPIRIGVHYGELRFGYVGTADRGEIRAIGDTVNTATRLETLNKLLGTQILVSAPVLEHLDVDDIRPLGEFLLAGKSIPISVVELGPGHGDGTTRELYTRFRDALRLFGERRWQESLTAFAALSQQFPEDGPVSFYHKTCQGYIGHPPPQEYTTVIPVEKPVPARIFNDLE